MTWEEWGRLVALIDHSWAGAELTEENEAAYFIWLREFDVEAVQRAIDDIAAEGVRFAPSAPEIRARVLIPEGDGSLRFGRAMRVVMYALKREQPERVLETEHPLYLRFLQEHPEMRDTDLSNPKYLSYLEWQWKELVNDWRAEVRQTNRLPRESWDELMDGATRRELESG
jgi:hypothetical protein